MIVNQFQMVKLLIFVFFFHLVSIAIYWSLTTLRKKYPTVQKICWRVNRFFTFEIYIMFALEAYTYILIHSLSESYGEFPEPRNVGSYVVSVLTFFFVLVLVLIIPAHYFRLRNREDNRMANGLFRYFYLDIKLGKTWPSMYYFWFCVRRIVMSLVVVFFSLTLTFYINTGFWLVVQWAFMVYLIVVMPFRRWWHTVIGVLLELCLGIVNIFIMIWDEGAEWNRARNIGIMSMMLGFVLVAVLI